MAKLRADVEGCGCVRCQQVEGTALQRSVTESFRWSSRLVLARPSIPAVFLGVGFLQLAVLLGPRELALVGALPGDAEEEIGRAHV